MGNKLSVVTPCYGSPETLIELVSRLSKVLRSLVGNEYEIILVNDACPKGSWEVISKICGETPNVKGVNLSRNFGQHAAISAGLHQVESDHTVVMDCDLQDIPEEIPKLYEYSMIGVDVVFGRRLERKDSWIKKAGSRVFYLLYDYMTGFNSDHTIANFSIVSRKVVESYKQMKEQHRPYSYFINWLGFERVDVDIQHAERKHGKSSYNIKKLVTFALNSTISQTNKLLRMSIKLGFILSFSAFFYGLFILYEWMQGGLVQGWTSLIVAIFFSTGIILANLGLVGLYIGKIFDETKGRPTFIVSEVIPSIGDNSSS